MKKQKNFSFFFYRLKHLEEIHSRIKDLHPKEKIKAIALNNLYLERKALEEEMEMKMRKIAWDYEKKYMPIYKKVNILLKKAKEIKFKICT